MASKIKAAQSQISGVKVAEMILDFGREFDEVYGNDIFSSSLCAVGPLQSMIGLAIKNGRRALPPVKDTDNGSGLLPRGLRTTLMGS